MVDLLEPFREFLYYHPAQHGSASMKSVLPALTGFGYDHLAIQEGGTACLEFLQSRLRMWLTTSASACGGNWIEEYCTQDTMGMVWIVESLRKLAA